MRIVIIGSRSFDSLEFNLQESFNYNGHTCEVFDIYDTWCYNINPLKKYTYILDWLGRRYSDKYDQMIFERLRKKVLNYRPDLVIGIYRFIHPEFVKSIKDARIKIIHINPDALTTFEYQQLFVEAYDIYFTKDPYILNFMKNNLKLNVKLYNEAFNIRTHKKPLLDKRLCEDEIKIDVSTYGTMYPYRSRMLSHLLGKDYNLKVYGVKPHRFYNSILDDVYQNEYIVGERKSRILYGSKIVFNQMHYAEIYSVNNRFFEVNGSGGFQLSDYRPILKDLLPIDPEYISFKSIDEGVEKIRYYLAHTQERIEIAEKIYNYSIQYFTYDHLIKYILENI